MPHIVINGEEIEVEQLPERIPSYIRIGDKKIKIKKELYLLLWANAYATKHGQTKLASLIK